MSHPHNTAKGRGGLTKLFYSAAYPLARNVMSKRARGAARVHGPLHRGGHELAVNLDARGQVRGSVDVGDEEGPFVEFLSRVCDDV